MKKNYQNYLILKSECFPRKKSFTIRKLDRFFETNKTNAWLSYQLLFFILLRPFNLFAFLFIIMLNMLGQINLQYNTKHFF